MTTPPADKPTRLRAVLHAPPTPDDEGYLAFEPLLPADPPRRSYDEDEETMRSHFNVQPRGLPGLLCFFVGHDYGGEDGYCRRPHCSSGKDQIPRLELGDNSLAEAINPGPTFTYAVEIGSIAEPRAHFVTFAGSRYSVATTAQAARDCLFPGDACAAGDCVEVAKLGPLYIGRLVEMT